MRPMSPRIEPESRTLATRVSKACDRCRRNKSRCDPYRPCSLCVRAGAECLQRSNDAVDRVSKRRRTQGPSRGLSHRTDQQDALQQVAEPHLSSAQTEPPLLHHDTLRGIGTNPTPDLESRRPSIVGGEAGSAVGIAQKICRLGDQNTPKRLISAIPGGESYGRSTSFDRTQRRPIPNVLGYALPPDHVVRTLLEEYFKSVHWFSLVIYEPKFRTRFNSIQDGFAHSSQKSFLVLLSVMLGMSAWYKSHRDERDASDSDEDWRACSLALMQGAGSQLTDMMDQTSIASVQACILLGSYYVYHGKPNLSFALLGATIKTAQAIGLHRQILQAAGAGSIEERKRVWWTIYTWDRFASITYGRPLGINDKDCNVAQPADVLECSLFVKNQTQHSLQSSDNAICYSSYQRELNKLYLAASPIIETIYGMRTNGFNEHSSRQRHVAQVRDFTEKLWTWRKQLPPHLLLDLSSDCETNQQDSLREHRLQALALQLTFDNLLIIFYRPILAQQVDHLIRFQPDSHLSAYSPSNLSLSAPSSPFFALNVDSPLSLANATSPEQWWNAALRTSKVTEMPQLAQLATDSHLIAFMAINLFNSAIVMAVLALSDPLSDRAQEVKRIITRIYRLMDLLGKKAQLSMQSKIVLKDVIQMLLRREEEAMLAPIVASNPAINNDSDLTVASSEGQLISVEETLRLPMQLPFDLTHTGGGDHQQLGTVNKAIRLNESLAAVQRVFPVGLEGGSFQQVDISNETSEARNPSIYGARDIQGEHEGWPSNNLEHSQPDVASSWAEEQFDVGSGGNGLYWFWDNTWDEA